jgi:hypothetical protein
MNAINERQVLILGDNHGKYEQLFRNIDHFDIRDCVMIHVGDGGEGFMNKAKQLRQFELFNNSFKKRNIEYMSIRGNHSNPAYFDGSICYENFKLLPDYTTKIINGQKFLFVGGALSIDRKVRIMDVSYWKDEKFVYKPELVTEECDVLITHSAPTWLGPFDKDGILSWCDKDEYLWRECVQERLDISELVEKCNPQKLYCGHFHISTQMDYGGYRGRILDELELVEHR